MGQGPVKRKRRRPRKQNRASCKRYYAKKHRDNLWYTPADIAPEFPLFAEELSSVLRLVRGK